MSLIERITQWAQQTFGLEKGIVLYGNPVGRWLIALAVFVVALVLVRLAKALFVRRAAARAEASAAGWAPGVEQLARATKFWFLLVVSLYLGSLCLSLPPRSLQIVRAMVAVVLLLQAGLWGSALLRFLIARYTRERLETDAAAVTTVSALGFVGKLVLWSVVVLMILGTLGVNISALVAGLGIGGIAVALAAQNILGDLFASLSIILDKPFVLNDFIIIGDYLGSVERIGLKTTRIRSLSGEQLIFSNTDLLTSRIRNYKRMQERRIVFSLGVTYETPFEKLSAIPAMLREAVEAQQQTRFDRAHFKSYGDFALIFEIVYYVLTPDYKHYMDIQEAINLAIYQRFEREGIAFAYPTQTVYLQQYGG